MSDWKLLNTSTASGASSVEFTDLTGYKIFKFVCIDINVSTDNDNFLFQVNASGQSGFNETMTTTSFRAFVNEDGSSGTLAYDTSKDQGQGTAYQSISQSLGNGADECCAGELHLFNPASTTYVKHFYSRFNGYQGGNFTMEDFISGYINTTSAITQISFKPESNTFDGVIKQYGLMAT